MMVMMIDALLCVVPWVALPARVCEWGCVHWCIQRGSCTDKPLSCAVVCMSLTVLLLCVEGWKGGNAVRGHGGCICGGLQ